MSTAPLPPLHSPYGDATASPWPGAFAGLAALALAMGIGRFAFTPVLPMMLDSGAVTLGGGAWLASANYLGYLLGALSAMVLRVPAERAIRVGLLTIGLTTLAMGALLPLPVWLLLRLMAGMASAWVLISVSAWSLEWMMRHRRPFLSSLIFAGVGSGITAAGLICIALDRLGAGAGPAWFTLGLSALAITALIWGRFASDTNAASVGAAGRANDGNMRWNAESARLVLSYGLFGFGYIIPATFLPVMARQALGGSALFAWSWPVFGAAAALSVLAVARLACRFGNRRLWLTCHLIMAAGVALPLLSAHPLAILGAALGVGGTFMVITLAALQEARRVAGRHATRLIAAMTAAFAAGQILGPLTIGADAGFSGPLLLAALVLLGGAALLTWPHGANSSRTEG